MNLLNKYNKCYYNIINVALSRVNDPNAYTEKHHILPRSLGGTDAASNIVKLTAREHFICHLLLPKFTTGNNRYKMVHALWFMSNTKKLGKRYKPSSRIYEQVKEQRAAILRGRRGEAHPNFGKKHPERTTEIFTPEWKERIAASKRGKPAWNKGIPRTEAECHKMSETRKKLVVNGLKPWNIGISRTDADKQKIKEANTGKQWIHNPNNPSERKQLDPEDTGPYLNIGWILGLGERKILDTCPHCQRSMDVANLKKWHGDKCKYRQ